MQNNEILRPQDVYFKHLEVVNGIRFTPREIDIIAYLLSGRSPKGISSFLCRSPKTIESHIGNIMMKMSCHSREGIITFIEKSKEFSFIKKYYLSLLTQNAFEKCLQQIGKLIEVDGPTCHIFYLRESGEISALVAQLDHDLKLIGIKISMEIREGQVLTSFPFNDTGSPQSDFILYPLTGRIIKLLSQEKSTNKAKFLQLIQQDGATLSRALFLLLENEEEADILKDIPADNYVSFLKEKNYYNFVFSLLKKLLPSVNLEEVISSFKAQCENIYGGSENIHVSPSLHQNLSEEKDSLRTKNNSLPSFLSIRNTLKIRGVWGTLLGTCVFCLLLWVFIKNGSENTQEAQETSQQLSFTSNFSLPSERASLDRPKLLSEIEERFKDQEGIQTVALVGMGGAGKSTLARQYAKSQKCSLIWEINAETTPSLINSFEALALSLAKSVEEKNVLRNIQDIKDPQKRIGNLISFIKEKLKASPNWILIWDNLDKFSLIQKYLPNDPKEWGCGKVIITTQDSNIQNNSYINVVVNVEELNHAEKLSLFMKIMYSPGTPPFTLEQQEEAKKFLEAIPPFPLDVLVAACYLKATHISYDKYKEYLKKSDSSFIQVQEAILKEANAYRKTRYGIITLTLQHLINAHKDFRDLLFLISLLDSQNIPRELLDAYKTTLVVDEFVYNLKKYSLLINESTPSQIPTLSIHRSTQEMSVAYFTKLINPELRAENIQYITEALENYLTTAINQEDLSKMKLIMTHCKTFLNHATIYEKYKGIITNKLGYIYYYLGNPIKAQKILENNLLTLKKHYKENDFHVAQNLSNLGIVYRDLGDYPNARDCLEKSLQIYQSHFPENHMQVVWVLSYLGNVYRNLGKFEKARELLEKSVSLYEKFFPENRADLARSLAYLGAVNNALGCYERAKDLLEQSKTIYKTSFSQNHAGDSWVSAYLGDVYGNLGDYEKAKVLLEKSLETHKKYFPENHIDYSWVLALLGNVYGELGNYEKAKALLEESIIVCNKYFPEGHSDTAWVAVFLGNVHRKLGNFKDAKNLIEASLLCFEKAYGKNHVETARILGRLGQAYGLTEQTGKSESFLHKAATILQKEKHTDAYIFLEDLAEISLKKSLESAKKGETKQSQAFKQQAIRYLKEALNMLNGAVSKNSPHLVRIQSKLKNLS